MFAAATVFAYGCSDNFDDSALWKDIDGMYKSLNELKAQVTTMQQQLDALAAVVSGGAVTSTTWSTRSTSRPWTTPIPSRSSA